MSVIIVFDHESKTETLAARLLDAVMRKLLESAQRAECKIEETRYAIVYDALSGGDG